MTCGQTAQGAADAGLRGLRAYLLQCSERATHMAQGVDHGDSSRFPERVYVKHEPGQPGSDIFDASTGKRFDGVVDVDVHVGRAGDIIIEVEATQHWPIGPADHVINHNDTTDGPYRGPEKQGLKTARRAYPGKRLEVESI